MNFIEKYQAVLKTLTDSRHTRFRLQRLITSVFWRDRVAVWRASKINRKIGFLALPLNVDMSYFLASKGHIYVQDIITFDMAAIMRDQLLKFPLIDPYRKHLGSFIGPDKAPTDTHVAFYKTTDVATIPYALEIANNPNVLSLVQEILGARPTISAISCWWSLPTAQGSAQHAENFHRDVDDTKFLKLFCYLTDVDETSGPHVFVEGSHLDNRLTKIRRYTDQEVSGAFGFDKLVTFMGPAGTSFLENTYGFHRGYPPSQKRRLNFQVLYTLEESIYGPDKPFLPACTLPSGADLYVNRVYVQS